MKKLLLTMLGVLIALPALARDFTYEYQGNTLTYTVIDEDTRTVSTKDGIYGQSGNEVSGALILPANPKDGDVEYTLTTIGNCAFYECGAMTLIEIPNSVTYIGGYAFSKCIGLTSVAIPNSVTHMGYNVFNGCSNLVSVAIPNSIISIGNWFFTGCSSLVSVEIPNSVTSIGDYAFESCSSLVSVAIPNSVTNIGTDVFAWCSSLTSIDVDSGNPNYSSFDGVLFTKDFSQLIYYPGGRSCDYVIPNSVTYIVEGSFYTCSGLTSVEIPNSVTTIGKRAFHSCKNLTSVAIPNSVTFIADETFSGCSSLTSIEIPNSVTAIGKNAFFNCNKLTSVEIPNSVITIGKNAFARCRKLASVAIPNSVTTIGETAFARCDKLTSVFYNTTEPIEVNTLLFDNNTYSNATLYVPESAVGTFRQTEPWCNFQHIQGYDFPAGVEDVTTGFDKMQPCEYFNLTGMKAGNTREELVPGIYIMRQGKAVRKIAVN